MDPIAEHYGWTDTAPNWITAGAAIGALLAAIWAGCLARQNLIEIQEQSRAFARSHLDERAPIILATALPYTRHDSRWVEYQVLGDGYRPIAGPQPGGWQALPDNPTYVPNSKAGFVRTVLRIDLENVSAYPAVVTFLQPAGTVGIYPGEIRQEADGPPLDRSLTIAAGRAIAVLWVRQVPIQSLSDNTILSSDAYSRFTATFVVTDIGRTVEDIYHFDEPLRVFFRGNGFESFVQIDRTPVDPWESSVAELEVNKRRYPRLAPDD